MGSSPPPPPPPPSSPAGGPTTAPPGTAGRRLPSDDEIQRILSSRPRSLEAPSPLRGFSITAVIGTIAGAVLVVSGLSSQGKTADQHSVQAIHLVGGFSLICLASICRHTKRLSSRQDL